ncbi:MAG: ABC transporter ATP-binding protein [Paracoccaceae bacterium]
MIRVNDLNVSFGRAPHRAHVVRGVSFAVARGETLGIIGESGCGKSTVLRALAGLEHGWTGTIELNGAELGPRRNRHDLRLAQMVFQDPYGSLHPRHRIRTVLTEPLRAMGRPATIEMAETALRQVGLSLEFADRFPHQLSGGQRQRVAIARALILEPPILLLDEPTSALDVSVQAEILNLLADRRDELGFTSILVSHDLSVIAHMCDRVLVMLDGAFVDELDRQDMRSGTTHAPYSAALFAASQYGDIAVKAGRQSSSWAQT